MLDFLNLVYFNNSIENYLIAISIFLGLFIVFRLFRLILIQKLKIIFQKTKTDFDDLIIGITENISVYFYWFIAFFFGIRYLNIEEKFLLILNKALILFIIYELVIATGQLVDWGIKKLSEKKDRSAKAAYLAIGKFLKWIIWIGAILTILSSFGFNITTLITGLGIGGIAVAFALQGVLKDLFSYFSILLDKPVRIGDRIEVGGEKGVVKDIGLKTTRLLAVDGEEVVIANDIITSTSLKNYGKAKERRVNIQYGVSYDTSVEKLKKLKISIKEIIEGMGEEVEFSRCHLRKLNDSSMDFDIVYYIKNRDYHLYMDINEEINFKILELFEKEKVEIPYPTQTIYTRQG